MLLTLALLLLGFQDREVSRGAVLSITDRSVTLLTEEGEEITFGSVKKLPVPACKISAGLRLIKIEKAADPS
jgi:hypothetical protein